jgi:hypothetical protein
VISRLVERYGRVGFAAISSVMWFFPMAAWAGSFDLSPMDKTAYPWIALAIGVLMLVVWVVVLTRIGRIPVSPRQRRFDLAQMSEREKRWALGCAAFILGLIAWLNAAATVDWGPLGTAISAGQAGPIILAIVLGLYVIVMLAGIVWTWGRYSRAFRQRTMTSRPAAEPAAR